MSLSVSRHWRHVISGRCVISFPTGRRWFISKAGQRIKKCKRDKNVGEEKKIEMLSILQIDRFNRFSINSEWYFINFSVLVHALWRYVNRCCAWRCIFLAKPTNLHATSRWYSYFESRHSKIASNQSWSIKLK